MVIERFEVYLVNLDPIGQINENTAQKVLDVLAEIFAP